ncbi:hypothetical protein FRB99_000622 [Tulasnella sp. 403]|nr:hypothetical protein FRB99_000622 [Tulasnella sp. 403]
MGESLRAFPEAMPCPPMSRVTLSETDREHTATPTVPASDFGPEPVREIPPQNCAGTVIGGKASTAAVPTKAAYDSLHTEIPRRFGEADEYWEQYDKLADRYDKERVQVLNNTLDTLLIFGGLFSAVTTSLIVYTLPLLNPPSDAQTVALLKLIALQKTNLTAADLEPPPFTPPAVIVRVNCYFGVSLAFSLLASFCALMAKQAVSHFARDYPSTLETHGRWHQRKLRSVAKWQFQTMVESLPLLLLIALVVFIIGVTEGLRSTNQTVTIVMSIFGITCVVGFPLLGIVAIIFPELPFQIPLTGFVRELFIWCWVRASQKWRRVRNYSKRRCRSLAKRLGRAKNTDAPPTTDVENAVEQDMVVGKEDDEKEDDQIPGGENDDDTVDTHSASWILEKSRQKETLLVTAKNVPALRTIKGTRLSQGEPAYNRLDSFFKNALTAWNTSSSLSHGGMAAQTGSDLVAALIYGRALVHCSIGGPPTGSCSHIPSSRVLWPKWNTSPSSDSNELLLIKLCLDKKIPRDFCANHAKNTFPDRSAALHIFLAAILEPSSLEVRDRKSPEKKKFRVSATKLDRITLAQWLASMSFANEVIISPISLNVGAWSLGNLPDMISGMEDGFTQEIRDGWWDAYSSEKHLHKNVVHALNVYHYYQRFQGESQPTQTDYTPSIGPKNYRELYIGLLGAFRKLIDTGAYLHDTHTLELDAALQQLRLSVSSRRDGRWHESTPNEIEKAIDETIRCLRKNALAVIFRRPPVFAGGFVAAIPGEADITSPLHESADFPQVVVRALEVNRKGSRYAALAMIRDDAMAWFKDDAHGRTLHQQFTEARLLPALSQLCTTSSEHLPLIGDIIVQLMNSSLWAEQVVEFNLPHTFLECGRDVLQGNQGGNNETGARGRSFRVVECILDVWVACKDYPNCKDLADGWHTPEIRQSLLTYINNFHVLGQSGFQSLPSCVPVSLMAYIADMEVRNINDQLATNLKDVRVRLTQELAASQDQDEDKPPPFPIARSPSSSSALESLPWL